MILREDYPDGGIMQYCKSTPGEDGYRMPGEFEPHSGCIMIWPVRPGSWTHGGVGAKKVFTEIATAISKWETVYMLADEEHFEEARAALPGEVIVVNIESDDSWARDVGPTFVKNKEGKLRGVNWSFNAWGGTFDGLYADWSRDDLVAKRFLEYLDVDCYDAAPFVLEGGSIHSDGEGTLLVTEACLLSPGRNPKLSREQIEEKLKAYLQVEKVIWLPCGIFQDETNEHVDNVCAFTAPGEVVLAWTEDKADPQYEMSNRCLQVLEQERDARGRKIKVRKLLIPKEPVCITEEELAGLVFEPGEDEREAGERLAASYVNFYIANGAIILPQFGDENDVAAQKVLQEAFPGREIVPVYARDIIVGGGNIHCITQQIPAPAPLSEGLF